MWTRSTDDYYNVFEANFQAPCGEQGLETTSSIPKPYPSVIGRNIHERELATARDFTSDGLITNLFLLVSHFR